MNILFLSSEAAPFAKTGGLGDVVGALSRVLAATENVTLILPAYNTESIREQPFMPVDEFSIWLGRNSHPVKVGYSPLSPGFSLFWIANDLLFGRAGLYGDEHGDYADNFTRFYVYQKAALEFIRRQGTRFDIIHCHDWQTALVPLFLRIAPPAAPFKWSKTVFSIHNLGYQGLFPPDCFRETGLPAYLFSPENLEFYGNLNCMKSGIIFSDRLVTVSPTYAREILTVEKGFGLDGLLRKHSGKLSGILNGVDYGQWDPRIDSYIPHRYFPEALDGKKKCKNDLLSRLGITQDASWPLVITISRISEQKGMALLVKLLPQLLRENLHYVFLGVGDRSWTDRLQEIASRFPQKMTFLNRFDEAMAHRLEAAGDIFFMPSAYEPCGLNQIYSLRYGTIPIVRASGGLQDSIAEFDPSNNEGTGFKFDGDEIEEVMRVFRSVLHLFSNRDVWRKIQKNGMDMDFSWDKQVMQYLNLYKNILVEGTQHG